MITVQILETLETSSYSGTDNVRVNERSVGNVDVRMWCGKSQPRLDVRMKRKRLRTYSQQAMRKLCGEIPKAELWIQEERVVDISVPTAVVLETPNGNVFCGYFPPGIHDLRPPAVKTTFDMQHIFLLCRRHCEYLLDHDKPFHARAHRCVKRVLLSVPELQLLARLDDETYVNEADKEIRFVTDEVAARIRDIYATVYSDEVGCKDDGVTSAETVGPSAEGGGTVGRSGPAAGLDRGIGAGSVRHRSTNGQGVE